MASGIRLAGAGLLPARWGWGGGRARGAIHSKLDDSSDPDVDAPLVDARAPSPTRSPTGSGSNLEMSSSLPSSTAAAPHVPPTASSPISSVSPAPRTPAAPRSWLFGRLGDVFGTWRGRRASSGSWPFGSVGDVFGTWPGPRPSPAHMVAPVTIFVVGARAAPGQHSIVQIPINFTLPQGPQFTGTHGANLVATVASQEARTEWMKMFRDLLLAFVFFTLPIVLVFFPKFDQAKKNDKETQKHATLFVLLDNTVVSTEKSILLVLFVLHASLGLLGVLLSHIANGPVVKQFVAWFTLIIITSVMAFVDYILLRTLPDNRTNELLFLAHFILMAVVTWWLWNKYVGMSCFCKDDDGNNQQDLRYRPPVCNAPSQYLFRVCLKNCQKFTQFSKLHTL